MNYSEKNNIIRVTGSIVSIAIHLRKGKVCGPDYTVLAPK